MPYDNRGRAASARRTRSAVLGAAQQSFLVNGYAATTIRGIADAAGVSQETVYKRFGSKAALLKDVYDVTMAGDEEPVPIAARPQAIAVRNATGPAEAARAYAAMSAWLAGRAGDLMRVVLSVRGGDPDLDAFMATVDAERLTGATMVATAWHERGWLRTGLDLDRARDQIWTLNSPAVWMLLTERGWTNPEYERWMADALAALVLQPVG